MIRRSFVLFCVAVVLLFVIFSSMLSSFFLLDDSADENVPMSITHEQFYVSPPRGHHRPPPKYFFEAVVKQRKKYVGLHYDRTYFKRELSDTERATAIRYMLEAWFDFLNINNYESWIAHGTLLGWYWNGEPLPWDVDVDVQMFVRTMIDMNSKFNNTLFDYETAEGEKRSYYININPFFLYRSRSNGQNLIDGRFVDTQTGLYIDMTSLAEADPIRHPNIISCKNNHKYLVDDILPLRTTMFIGKRVYIPYEYEKVLQKEYSRRGLTNGKYNGYIYSVQEQKWIKESVFKEQHRSKQDIGKGPSIDPMSRPVLPPNTVPAGSRAMNSIRVAGTNSRPMTTIPVVSSSPQAQIAEADPQDTQAQISAAKAERMAAQAMQFSRNRIATGTTAERRRRSSSE
ncbi:LicD family-domain-containing protein [Lipomyces arxii]|uniref:LicD family-domain-containing protein n=1 Tax=Lipomyces arxii TaxID=56418 RepID=UPI0034CE8849